MTIRIKLSAREVFARNADRARRERRAAYFAAPARLNVRAHRRGQTAGRHAARLARYFDTGRI